MATVALPASLSVTVWNSKTAGLDKSKSASRAAVEKDLALLQSQHKAIDWGLLDIDRLSAATDIQARIKAVEAEKKSSLDRIGKQLSTVLKSADDFSKQVGKVDAKIGDAVKAIRSDASAQTSAIEKEFAAALAALAQKLKTAAKTVAKPAPQPVVPAGAAKKAQATANTYRKLAFEAIVKARTRPHLKPSRFMVVEFKKSVRFYMGMKYDKSKTTETLKAMNPKDTYVRTHVDPNSKVIWEKNALTLISNKIPLKFAKQMSLACKPLLGKAFKLRMRKETGEVEEADDPEAKDVSDAELAAELARMPADPEADDDEDTVSDDSVDDEAVEAAQTPAAKTAASAGPAAKTAASAGPAAKSAGPAAANGALETARRQWVSTRESAKTQINDLFAEIGKLYGKGQESQLAAARKTLNTCMEVLAKLDGELDAVLRETDAAKRATKMAATRATVQTLSKFVTSNNVMANLDDNEVRKITAAASLRSSLQQVQAALA